MTTLLSLITEQSGFLYESTDNIDAQIKQYFKLSKELLTKQAQIQQQLNYIQSLDKSLKNKLKAIQTMMVQNKQEQRKVDNWVARLRTVLKYKQVRPDYKQLWTEALSKVNAATKNLLIGLQSAQVQTKKAATKIQLELVQQSLIDIVKSLISKFKKFISASTQFKKATKNLPNIKDYK